MGKIISKIVDKNLDSYYENNIRESKKEIRRIKNIAKDAVYVKPKHKIELNKV